MKLTIKVRTMCCGNTKDGVPEFGKEGTDLPATINSWLERGRPTKNGERSLMNLRGREEIAPPTEEV